MVEMLSTVFLRKHNIRGYAMRKLLLGTTALAAAATLSANAALADVSVSGYYEWKYQSTSSDITANDGTTFGSDSEIKFSFSNKTDSGLTIGMTTEMFSDGDEGSNTDEGSLSVSGGFGKFVMGQNDFVGDNYGVASTDLPAEEIYATGTDTLSVLNGDITDAGGDANKIAYHLPAMGGLTAGVSIMNSGAVGDADSTAYGAKYAMDAGGAAVTLGFATVTTENATQDIDSQVVGVKVSSGNITAAVSQSTYEASNADEESTGAAVSFKVNDATTVTLHTAETDDGQTTESYSNSGIEIAYTIASGLQAFINVEDYDYKAGNSAGNTNNAGTASKLTIKATF